MKPSDQAAPAFRGTIRPGRHYRLRNGARVKIIASKTYTWGTSKDGIRTVEGWLGEIPGSGQKLTWQKSGWYAPEVGVRPHPLDIIGTAI